MYLNFVRLAASTTWYVQVAFLSPPFRICRCHKDTFHVRANINKRIIKPRSSNGMVKK